MKKSLYLILLFVFSFLLITFSIQNVSAVETHTITFVTGDENIVIEPFEVEDGDTINDKGIDFYPQRVGYAYPEWYTDASFTNEFDYESKIYEDTTLYAKWLVSIEEIRITSDLTSITDGEMLPEFTYSLETANLTIGNVSWYGDEADPQVGDKVDGQKEYSIYMSAKANDGYTLDGAIVYFNDEEVGEWIAWPLSMGGEEIGGTFFIPMEVNPSLEIIKGTDTYTIGETTEAEFEINADYSLFQDGGEVFVDGNTEPLNHNNYDSREGSTIITLKETYVDTLTEGEHTLKVLFNDNRAAITSFNVVKNTSQDTETETNTDNNNTQTNTDNKSEDQITPPPTRIDNPATGNNFLLYMLILSFSIVGLGKTIFKKRFN